MIGSLGFLGASLRVSEAWRVLQWGWQILETPAGKARLDLLGDVDGMTRGVRKCVGGKHGCDCRQCSYRGSSMQDNIVSFVVTVHVQAGYITNITTQ